MNKLTIPVSNEAYKLAQKISKRDLSQAVLEAINSLSVSSNGLIVIDPERAKGFKLQKDWGIYFDTQGKLTIAPEHILQSEGDVRESLRKDCIESWIKTGTGLDYLENSLEGNVVYNRGSKHESRSPKILIPVFRGTPLPDALKAKGGLRYKILQLHEKYTTAKKIIDAEAAFAGKKPNGESYEPSECLEWTRGIDSRKNNPKTAVEFNYGYGRFHVLGDGRVGGDDGHSRGVRLVSSQSERTRKK